MLTTKPILSKQAYKLLSSSRPLTSNLLQNGRISVLIFQSNFSTNSHQQFIFTSKSPIQSSHQPQISQTQIIHRETKQSWPHPVYTLKQMNDIEIAHLKAKNWSDKIAILAVKLLRSCFDIATGYKHDPKIAAGEKAISTSDQRFAMNEKKWMIRFIFLESIAGVPGFVAGTLRHLKSLRTLRRDNGWIETLLEEGYNERMHLLTFLKLYQPGLFMRLMIIAAQGVFYNGFFISYLLSPRTCHRFVGYLEEEAVITYSRALADLNSGKLPKWENLDAPELAVKYWNMGENAKMKDVLLYIRADEAKHREVNHTLANLDVDCDPNPFMTKYEDPTKPHPSKGIEHIRGTGWTREESLGQ